MVEPVRTTQSTARGTAIVVAITLVILNVAFFALSEIWLRDAISERSGSNDLLMGGIARQNAELAASSARIAFAILSALLAAASFLASLAPRRIGHSLGLLAGTMGLIASFFALTGGSAKILGATLLISGVLLWVMSYFSFLQRSRAAWSFLISTLAVFAAVTLFGAPKIRGELGVGLWTALIIPGLLTVAVIALAMVRGDYRDANAFERLAKLPDLVPPPADAEHDRADPDAEPRTRPAAGVSELPPSTPMPAKLLLLLVLMLASIIANLVTASWVAAGIGVALTAGVLIGNDGIRTLLRGLATLLIAWDIFNAAFAMTSGVHALALTLFVVFGVAVPAYCVWTLGAHDVREWMFRKNFKVDPTQK